MKLLVDGPESGTTFVFAHGAGLPMDAPFMQFFAKQLSSEGIRVVRFEFPYMQRRRKTGRSGPPDRADRLIQAWLEVIELQSASNHEPLIIGGKSMGGRVATMVAEQVSAAAVLCLGYPFHPPRKPESLRTAHLETLDIPTLIVQGTRDPFGSQLEVSQYALSESIEFLWLEDGDHSFVPRKSFGVTEQQNLDQAVAAIIAFIDRFRA